MPYTPQAVGETCNQCGKAEIIENPNTGKTFCKDKCWLKKTGQTSAPETTNSSVCEAKDRLSAGQTALNCVANIYQGKGDEATGEAIKTRFVFFYNLLRQAKAGLVVDPSKLKEEVKDEVSEDEIPF